MENNQKFALIVFLSGLFSFFYFGSEVLVKHSDWSSFKTPLGMADIFGVFSSVTATVAGALGLNVTGLIDSLRKK